MKRLSENKGLPKRWRYFHGAYYYLVPAGLEYMWDGKKSFRLGVSLAEAHKVWSSRLGASETIRTVGQLLDRYARDVIPTKAKATQVSNLKELKKIRVSFGEMPLSAVRPVHIYQFYERRRFPSTARREIALLSHAYTKAVEWGFMDRHPFKGEIRLKMVKPRTRYVTDDELLICLALPPVWKGDATKMVQAYIRVKLLTGLRRGDLLRLRVADLKEDGIHVTTQKTKKAIIIEWSDELRAAIAMVPKKVDIAQHVFSNRKGLGYENEGEASGWDSIWQRFMKRAVDAGVERFTEHDLRAKAASDAGSLEQARALLAHADSKITNKVYRRKPEKVRPLR